MLSTRFGKPLIAAALGVSCLGAAPVTPSYYEIQQPIDRLLESWQKPDAPHPANAPGWNAFFAALRSELRAYSAARDETTRLRSLDRIYRMWAALQGVSWKPAAETRAALRDWLTPRIQLAWAERRLIDTVKTAAGGASPNRSQWVQFVDDGLGTALRQYEGAATVAEHQAALRRIYSALNNLRSNNRAHPWGPSQFLEAALNALFNRPNLDATADVATLSPVLNQNLVKNEVIYFKGQMSYVTPGPKTGFGLVPSDDGIAFFNSQLSTSLTPIRGFNEQMEQDPRGRRATKLYHFDASSSDNSQISVTGVLRTDGLSLFPSYAHDVGAAVASAPAPGGGVGRLVAGLIGMNQKKITKKVEEGALPKIRQGVQEGAMELGAIRTGQAAAEQNARLRKYLVGNNTLAVGNLEIDGLSLRSRPEYALVGGTVVWRGANEQLGADFPQPPKFATFQPGVAADLHLPSVMTNLIRGYLQSPAVADLKNLMIVTKQIPPGAPPREGIVTSKNVDFATFSQAVETARAANDPKVLAIRVKKPGQAPEFAADSEGNLVALVHDFALEVPAPPQAARGGLMGTQAKIYMLAAPNAEFRIAFKVETAHDRSPVRLSGRIVGFDPGPGARVFAVNDDETKATPLTSFAARVILSVFGTKLQGQPIDIPLSNLQLRGFELTEVSPLDPSGWIRLVLASTGQRPAVTTTRTAAATSPRPTVRVAEQ